MAWIRASALAAAVFALYGGLWAPAARAAQPAARARAHLEWTRAPEATGCIDADDLASAAERLLGRAVFQGVDAPLLIRGSIGRDGPGGHRWVARLTMMAGDQPLGARELTSPAVGCHALDDSLAVVLALMVDFERTRVVIDVPAAAGRGTELSPSAAAGTAPAIAEATTEATMSRAPSASSGGRARWRWEGAVGAVVAAGVLPSTTGGPVAAVALRPPELPVSFEVGARALLPATDLEGSHGSRAWAAQAQVGVCTGRLARGVTSLDACLRLDAGRYQASGVGLDVARSATGPLIDAAGSARLWLRWGGPVAVRLAVEAAVPLVRNRFTFANSGETAILFQSALVAPRAELALVMATPD